MQYGAAVTSGTSGHDPKSHAAPGLLASFSVTPNVDVDLAASRSLSAVPFITPWEGGRPLFVFAGAKVGHRSGLFGTFIKVRIGASSCPDTLRSLNSTTGVISLARSTTPMLDIGYVIEAGLGSRMFLRLDLSDMIAFYRGRLISLNGSPVFQPSPGSAHSIHTALGLGVIF
jgi:hypothetical protein